MASSFLKCEKCGHDFPDDAGCCPHCGWPGLYVNVKRAERDDERKELQRRYDAAIVDAQSRGCEAIVRDFEQAAGTSAAVLARPGHVVQRLFSADTEIYGTYLKEVRAGLRVPEGTGWDLLRSNADNALFGAAGAEIRFAALTLDAKGLFNYGDHVLFLREDMIAHRASVFEGNSALLVESHRKKAASPEYPPGHRATWQERAKLCVAKLGSKIAPTTKPGEYATILLSAGATSAGDEFVEVHICGPVTIRTFERVALRKRTSRLGKKAARKQFRARLKKYGVALEVI